MSALPKKLETNIPISINHRKSRALYTWLSRVTGTEACWVEGVEYDDKPVWGFIKRVARRVLALHSIRWMTGSILALPLLLATPEAALSQNFNRISTAAHITINGVSADDLTGRAVSIGDVNGDGIGDMIIGTPFADQNGTDSGKAYVVFGKRAGEGFSHLPILSSLDGSTGFVLNGQSNGDRSGWAVSTGDINGDAIADVIIGAPQANSAVGRTYVVFGKSSFAGSSSIELSSLDGNTGFILNGQNSGDQSGLAVSTGDINGDTIADVIIGAPYGDLTSATDAGKTYVLFGKNSFSGSSSIELSSLDGNTGFILNGQNSGDRSGWAVSTGDTNGDGVTDLVVGAPWADLNGANSGRTYIVFGKPTGQAFASTMNLNSSLLNGATGFALNGARGEDQSGYALSSGDINGDGIADLVVGAPNAYVGITQGVFLSRGKTYVAFGKNDFAGFSSIELSSLDGSTGFVLNGGNVVEVDRSGQAVSSGDINGDGIADVVVGAREDFGESSQSGRTYVVFGKTTPFASAINLSPQGGNNGFILFGESRQDHSGWAVSSGDVTGDGVADVMIGAPWADSNGSNSGRVYIFSNIARQSITGNEGYRMLSSPDHGTVFNELIGSLWTQGFAGSDSPTGGASNVWMWDVAGQAFVSLSNQATDILPDGHGFAMYVYSDDNGPGVAGNAGFPKNLSVHQFGGTARGGHDGATVSPVSGLAANAFFLVGNPFPGAIGWDDADITKTNLSNTIYVWSDTENGGLGNYVSWNGLAGGLVGGVISPFQSFFVQASVNGGALSIPRQARTNANNTLRKQLQTKPKVLKVHAQAGELETDAWLTFQEGGELSRDNFDGLFLQPLSSEYLRLATTAEGSELLQINALPLDQQEPVSLPLDLSGVTTQQTAVLTFEGLEAFEGWQIAIHDNDTGKEYPVTEGGTIELAITKINTKAVPALTMPVPTPMKAKTRGMRYSIILQPEISVGTEDPGSSLPTEVALDQNYPNPFNPTTNISFAIPQAGEVKLEIFDLLGRQVATLVNGRQVAGRYTANFDASAIASGIYIYRLQVGARVLTRKLTLIK